MSEAAAGLRAHVAVFCAAVGGFMCLYCTQAIYPELQGRFGLSVTEAGALLTATTLGLALAAPFAGRVASRWGTQAAIRAGLVVLVLSSLLFGLCSQRAALVATRLFQGLAIPVVLSALLASINARWSGGAALGLSATYVTGTVLGGVIGRFLPALVMPGWGWLGAFTAFAAVQAGLLAVVWRLFPRIEMQARLEVPVRAWLVALWPMLRTRLTGVAAAGFCLLFAQTAVTTYIAVRLAAPPYGWSTEALGALYAVFLPALVFVRFTPRAMARLGPLLTLRSALGLGWLGLAFTVSSSVLAILLGLALFSVAVFVGQTVLSHWAGGTGDVHGGMSAGIYLCFYYLGGSTGALVPALVWSQGGWLACLLLIALVQIGTASVIWVLRRRGG